MDKEVVLFTKPEELVAWAEEHDLLMDISKEDAKILLGYMEGHDYAIGSDSQGKLYRKDVAEENGEITEYSIDDVIDAVCEWNYELILEADANRNNPDYGSEEQERYERYKADEIRLDRLFDKTSYAKEIELMAEKLAMDFIANLKKGDDIDRSVSVITEGVKQYQTGKRGR
jgi:hypothetical protein